MDYSNIFIPAQIKEKYRKQIVDRLNEIKKYHLYEWDE